MARVFNLIVEDFIEDEDYKEIIFKLVENVKYLELQAAFIVLGLRLIMRKTIKPLKRVVNAL